MSPISFWLIAALILAGLEVTSGTFYLLSLATGLVFGSLAAWIGLSLPWQVVCAAGVSILAVMLLCYLKNKCPQRSSPSMEVGQICTVDQWMDERRVRVRYRGTLWDGELQETAQSGLTTYFVVAVHGSTLALHQNRPKELP